MLSNSKEIEFVIGINRLFNTESSTEEKNVALRYFPVYTKKKTGYLPITGSLLVQTI